MNLIRKGAAKMLEIFAKYFCSGSIAKDKAYLKANYWIRMGKKLNLDSPVTFNEKI